MDVCIICGNKIIEGDNTRTSVLTLKGCEAINNVSAVTGETVEATIGDKVSLWITKQLNKNITLQSSDKPKKYR